MVHTENLNLRILLVAFFIILAATLFAGLYPFDFFPLNRVQWLSNEAGLYFDHDGIAYTDRAESISLKQEISVELLLKERRGSRNWGPKEIFSFYDGPISPTLLVGQWDGRIFIYSRFEKNEGQKYYRLFRTKNHLSHGKAQLVTVTLDEYEKAIYINGQLKNRKNVELKDGIQVEFSGSLLIGNSHSGKYGWNGEIKGLAIYNRILLPREIVSHSKEVLQKGMSVLADTPGCVALYPFDEGKGNTANSIANKHRPFSIPVNLNSPGLPLLSLRNKDMRIYIFYKTDFLKNILFFVPFGFLLSTIILKKHAMGYFATFFIVTLAGGFLSYGIENLQLLLHSRYPGLADILSNILGSGLGMQVAFFTLKGK